MYTHSLTTLRQCLRLRFACSHHDERDTVTRPGRGERRPGREHAASAILCAKMTRADVAFVLSPYGSRKTRYGLSTHALWSLSVETLSQADTLQHFPFETPVA